MAQAQAGSAIDVEETKKYVNLVESFYKIEQFAYRFKTVNTHLGVHNREIHTEDAATKGYAEINSLTDVVDFLPNMIDTLVEELDFELTSLEERLK